MSRSLIPGPEEYYCDQEETMKKVAAHTHYFPKQWKGRCRTEEVRQEFLHLFQYKTALFQQEILSVVVTPIILCFSLPEVSVCLSPSLPLVSVSFESDLLCILLLLSIYHHPPKQCAKSILDFLKDHHENVEGLGSVCSYSLFDLEKYGSVRYGGVAAPAPATCDGEMIAATEGGEEEGEGTRDSLAHKNGNGNVDQPPPVAPLLPSSFDKGNSHHHHLYIPHDGKVEKSYLNFRLNYPEWRELKSSAVAGDALLSRLHDFQVCVCGWDGRD